MGYTVRPFPATAMPMISLDRYLTETAREHPVLDDSLQRLIQAIARSCTRISTAVAKGALANVLGSAGTGNVQGEEQKKLDVISNQLLLEGNAWGGNLAGMASEEMEDPWPIPADQPRGRYLLLFDPLDGSSNIDVNISVGTIFSVLRAPEGVDPASPEAFLQPGTRQLAAGYAVYGSSTQLVMTLGRGVDAFTLDPETREFLLTARGMRIAEDTSEYAINASNQRHWEPPVQRYIQELNQGKEGPRGRDFNMRWVGSMVADVHRMLTRGGLFMYPLDAKCAAKGGKLRLMYEANPMGWIVEQAGGLASTGRERILQIQPSSLHQRVPVVIGARNEVERIEACHREA